MAKPRKVKNKIANTKDILDLFVATAKNDGVSREEGFIPNFLLTEEEKLKNDKIAVKKIFNYNESLCLGQLSAKRKKYEENYKLTKGVINKSDYFLEDEYKDDYKILDEAPPTGIDLEFFPIIPNIVNSLKQELKKKYVNFHPKMVDSQSINEYIYELNETVKNDLIKTIQESFMQFEQAPEGASQEELQKYEQELQKKFESLPHVQKAFQANYKPEIVKWAEHLLNRDMLKYNMENLSAEIFEDQLILNERYLHVNILNGERIPEWISPDKVGYIKSPHSKCVSEGTCVYFLEHLTVQGMITKYGYLLKEKDIEKITNFYSLGTSTGGFVLHDHHRQADRTDLEAMTNFAKLESLIDGQHLDPNTMELAHQYFIIPRKLGKVTIKNKVVATNPETGEEIVNIDTEIIEVDDTFKVPKEVKNEYEKGKEKTGENLLTGIHVDWYYINEVWRGIKASLLASPQGPILNASKSEDIHEDIWIKLEKMEYQGRPEDEKWDTLLPVFGGPVEYKKIQYSKSLVDTLAPFQKYYNYLMNKIKELVITELMPFYVLNKEMLGANSLEESWQDDPYFKFIISGQENGVTVADLEGANPQLLAAMPQQSVINLDRSNAIKTRWELAQLFKNEGYATVGTSPQFLGQVGQYENTGAVNAGIQQSTMQIQHLFDSHFELMRNVHQYMIDVAQVLHYKKGGMVELSYLNSDTQNQIFKIEAAKLPLSKKVGLYIVNSIKENEILFSMKQLALQDNTMGADGYEKALILTANSQASILDRLKEQQARRDRMQQQQQEMQMQMQERELEAAREERQASQEFEAKENQLDRELEYITTQMQTLGWMKDSDLNKNGQFDVTEIAKIDSTNQKISNDLMINKEKLDMERNKSYQDLMLKKQELDTARQNNFLTYQTKMQDIRNKRLMKELDFKIAKENKNKYDKK